MILIQDDGFARFALLTSIHFVVGARMRCGRLRTAGIYLFKYKTEPAKPFTL